MKFSIHNVNGNGTLGSWITDTAEGFSASDALVKYAEREREERAPLVKAGRTYVVLPTSDGARESESLNPNRFENLGAVLRVEPAAGFTAVGIG